MRNLTITRRKSFVACLGTAKVYIEDATSGEKTINGISCRQIGTLKNGETQIFSVDEKEQRVFVIFDSMSVDYYIIPAGAEDVSLSGQCKYNPAAGNAFRFDGVTDEEVLQNRKKNNGKGIVILIIAVIIGFAIGFLITSGNLN